MKVRKMLALLTAVLLSLVCVSCTTETILVRTSLTPLPETLQGIPTVAQGEPIRVVLDQSGESDVYMLDVDGYCLIHWTDMAALLSDEDINGPP